MCCSLVPCVSVCILQSAYLPYAVIFGRGLQGLTPALVWG